VLTVHKYPFEVAGRFALDLPRAAIILSAECQGRTPYLWAWVDTDEPTERVAFAVFGTGHEIPRGVGLDHVSTFQQGAFVWHLFRLNHSEAAPCN
jgi:hypothetical protein